MQTKSISEKYRRMHDKAIHSASIIKNYRNIECIQ